MASLTIEGLGKSFGAVDVIRDANLEIPDGEFVVFVGPSGCGKSTLLRLIAGLEEATAGDIRIDGESVVRKAAADRGVAMVFQSYALYPHMTVRENLSFGLENIRMKKDEIARRVDHASKLLRIDQYLERKPRQLSGGQRQRVAIGRAITRDPKIFLFDEPLSNLDAELRVLMRLEIAKLHDRLGNTMIYVTHDQVEAMTLADRIVVLRAGVIEQVGPPLELYNRPRNKFVGGFIGSPRMNFIPGRVLRVGESDFDLECDGLGSLTLPREGRAVLEGQFVSFGVRPEDMQLADEGRNAWPLKVDVTEQHGSSTYVHCSAPSGPVLLHIAGQGTQRAGEVLHVRPAPGRWHLFGADELRIEEKRTVITAGIDIGTSSVKVALVGDDDRVHASASHPLVVSRPHPGFSEQDPEQWVQAVIACLDDLKSRHATTLAATEAIGLSGHMHGATLLDEKGAVLRPCILWNDGRSAEQCQRLTREWPAVSAVTGNLAMPGFTAPKLMWVREHEPEVFARVAKVLLPKAYVRYRFTGEYIEEMSDASGTLWLDVAKREWSAAALAATGMRSDQMPRLVEGTAVAGELSAEWVKRWGFQRAPIFAGGAGDNAAGAVGVGAVHAGDAFVSLGTSGVLWATTAAFAPAPARAVHAFCHALPDTWHQMGVLLSAAASLAWWSGVCGVDEATLLGEIDASTPFSACWFAPYLNGERTPHNDALVRGGFAGLEGGCTRADMTLAVLEGVAYAMRDAQQALSSAGTVLTQADVIGGGARSPLWSQLMADVLNVPLHQVAESEIGCAFGAARLARLAAGTPLSSLQRPQRVRTFEPHANRAARHAERHRQWQSLYPALGAFARR